MKKKVDVDLMDWLVEMEKIAHLAVKQDGDKALLELAEKLVMASQEKEENDMWLMLGMAAGLKMARGAMLAQKMEEVKKEDK